MSRKRHRSVIEINDEAEELRPPVQKKPKKLQVTLHTRIGYGTEQIDTGLKNGIIENPFSDTDIIDGYSRIRPFFGNIHNHVIDLLAEIYHKHGEKNVYILGCVAWLTDPALIGALAQCAGVQLIVNDEDFGHFGGGKLRNLYDALPVISVPFSLLFAKSNSPLMRCADPKPPEPRRRNNTSLGSYFSPINLFGTTPNSPRHDTSLHYAAIRCIGSRSTKAEDHSDEPIEGEEGGAKTKGQSRFFQSGPIMHCKYIIPCVWHGSGSKFQPLGVLTGSMNFTQKSRQNQENLLWVESEVLGNSYLKNDYTRSFLASEPIRK
jgi:hypothetical protein